MKTASAALFLTTVFALAEEAPPVLQPVASTGTGLLLEPPLDLSAFTTEEFAAGIATVGPEKIRKKWTAAVTALPPHPRPDVRGLTEDEVKAFMLQVRRIFDEGAAVPVSDVGLISTQEDVIRRPMYNHISAFSNAAAHVYLLVQRTSTDKGWGYFSIVQDRTTDPPTDYYGEIRGGEVKLEGTSCYKCHSSGPLAIHPVREDLVTDPALAAAISKHIAAQPVSRFYFPADSPAPPAGAPLTVRGCLKCHDTDGDRALLYQVHAHPIRVLVDFGYMPPNGPLKPAEMAELKAWLDRKP